jgi:uncharacterized protein
MIQTQAIISTGNAQKYMTQLCKHWSHKFETALVGATGTVDLPGGLATFKARATELEISIALKSEDVGERMQAVVAEHLDRFAFREAPIACNWT